MLIEINLKNFWLKKLWRLKLSVNFDIRSFEKNSDETLKKIQMKFWRYSDEYLIKLMKSCRNLNESFYETLKYFWAH